MFERNDIIIVASVSCIYGLGLVETKFSEIGTKFNIEAYDELVNSEIVPLPFMKKKQMVNGQRLRCFGEVNINRGSAEMIHPEYQRINAGDPLPNSTHLTAIYPTVDGISQTRWRNYIEGAFAVSSNTSVETLIDTEKISAIEQALAADLFSSLKLLHYPPATIDLSLMSTGMHPLQRQLAFEELVAQRLSHLLLRKNNLTKPAIAIKSNATLEEKFLRNLTFTLTDAQQRVLQQIKNDIAKPCLLYTSPSPRDS